ncbi:MFS transporter [Streptomyces nanshensis]|uniref:MFS transporter n=1 Tax=Streptomyces nanshensis TaxID=518642 RepID=A0A1E7KV02_9ACTN|nr:MFS transporter [Streptomyces nanshensis]OEV07643.1 MFS transporter [Streptomyces nanshensis]
MATGYTELLRARHAVRLLAGTLTGRLPNATGPLAIVLFTRAEGGSYTLAGVLSAVYGLATAVGQPMLGRLVDLHGQPRVMLPAALLSALGMLLLAGAGTDPVWLAAAGVLVAGLCTPPLEGGLRALWPSVLKSPDRVHQAYALDAVAQEVMFAVGPLLVTVFVAFWNEAAALLVINVLGVLGALSVVVSPPSRAWRSAPREPHWLGALRSAGLLALLGTFFFVGLALGAVSVAAVSYADDHGDALVSTYLLSALGFGALAGGLVYGARQWAGAPERRLMWLVLALAAGYTPLVLVPGVVAMTALAGLAGVFLAPALACVFVVVDRHAPSGTVTEAFSWLVTTFGVGAAAGTAVVGPVIETGGTAAGFAVVGGGGLTAFLVLLLTRGALAPSAAPPREPVAGDRAPDAREGAAAGPGAAPAPASAPVTEAENDRNGAPQPGFRTGRQA